MLASVAVLTAVTAKTFVNKGAITLNEGMDSEKTVYVVSPESCASQITVDNQAGVNMTWGGECRHFLATEATDDMVPGVYYHMPLLNMELSFDVDISNVGCACNSALFFTGMPGYNAQGEYEKGGLGTYYCDANFVGGVWCWEHDTLESNKYTMATTAHKCASANGAYISSCDRGGCQTNAYNEDNKGMCADSSCKIDTTKPFRMYQSFEVDPNDSSKLTGLKNRFVQGSNEFSFSVCDQSDYMSEMSPVMESGMVMAFQLWGDTHDKMWWLDDMTGCAGDCNTETAWTTFSNIKLTPITSKNVTNAKHLVE